MTFSEGRGFFPPDTGNHPPEEESGYNYMAGIRFAEGQAILRDAIRDNGVQSKEVQDQAKEMLNRLYDESIVTMIDYFKTDASGIYKQYPDRFDALVDNATMRESLVDRVVGILQQPAQLERDADETKQQILENWREKIPDLFALQEKKEKLGLGKKAS